MFFSSVCYATGGLKGHRAAILTCPVFPRSGGRRAGPDVVCGGSAPAQSRPTSARSGPSVPRRTSGERLGLNEHQHELKPTLAYCKNIVNNVLRFP